MENMDNAASRKEMVCNIPAETQLMMDGSIAGYNLTIGENVAPLTVGGNTGSMEFNQAIYRPQPQYVWDWWDRYYYPHTIQYVPSEDKGAKAIRIAKVLMDKKLVKVNTVKSFIDMMDAILKEL